MSINKQPFIVDSHCHLNYEGLKDRVPEVIQAANDAGVKILQSICTRLTEFEDIYKITQEYDCVWASAGIHPHEADSVMPTYHNCVTPSAAEGSYVTGYTQSQPTTQDPSASLGMTRKELLDKLLEYAARPKTIGIGETGLDYYYDNSAPEAQKKSFAIHMEAASQSGLPIIIHTRDAEEDTYNMLKDFIDGKELEVGSWKLEENNKPLQHQTSNIKLQTRSLTGLLHCFTGTADMAKKCMDLGLYISISGIVTFKSANELRDVVKNVIPMDRLLVETDSPFLAPLPYRGKVCEPAYTRNTAEFIAELKGITLEELATKTTENFLRLFNKVKV